MFQSRSPRYPIRFDAVVDDGELSLSAPVTNLSDTGLFLETTTGIASGRRLRIIPLPVGAGGLKELEGEVVRIQDAVETGGVRRPPGIAVRFVHMLPPDQKHLRDFCRRALSTPVDAETKVTWSTQVRAPRTQARANQEPLESEIPASTESSEIKQLDDATSDATLLDIDAGAETTIRATPRGNPNIDNTNDKAIDKSETDFFAAGDSVLDAPPVNVDEPVVEPEKAASGESDSKPEPQDFAPAPEPEDFDIEPRWNPRGAPEASAWGATFGAAVILLVAGIGWTQGQAQIERDKLAVAIADTGGALTIANGRAQRLANAIDDVTRDQTALLASRGAPRSGGTVTITPIADGQNALVEARFVLDNPEANALQLGFQRTRVFIKEVPVRAPGAAPLALASPLARGAKGWNVVVDDARRAPAPRFDDFSLSRAEKMKFAGARMGVAEVQSGERISHTARWTLAAGRPAVVAVVQEWFWSRDEVPTAADVANSKKGHVERTVRMLGVPAKLGRR